MRIEHVTLLVKDRAVTLKFFKDMLGLEHKYVGRHAWVIVGEQYIHLTEDSGGPVANTFYHFAIERDDFDEYVADLRGKGVEVQCEPFGASAFVRDPDGNLIEFIKPWHS